MTPDQRHIIRTHTLCLTVARTGPAQALLAQAAGLARTRLTVEADEVFTRHAPPRRHLRLERVELALGFIPEERLARDLPERFRAALEAEILRQLRAGEARDDDGANDSAAGAGEPASRLALLGHLLLHGTLPWWAPPGTDFDPATELSALLASAPAGVVALLRRIGRTRAVRFRLVGGLADPAIAVVIRALAPSEAAFILAYAADLDARQREEPFVPASTADFRQAKWEVILGHLLADAGSRFNAKAFLRQTLRALADRFRLDYAIVLAALAASARRVALTWREVSLPGLLLEIEAEDRRAGGDVSPAAMPGGGPDSEGPAPGEPLRPARGSDPGGTTRPAKLTRPAILDRWAGWIRRSTPPPAAEATALAFWDTLPPPEARALVHELLGRHGLAALLRLLAALAPAARAALRDRLEEGAAAANARPSPGREAPGEDSALATLATALDEEDGKPDELSALRTFLETGRLPRHPAFTGWHDRPGDWLSLILVRHATIAPRLLRAWAAAPQFSPAMLRRLPRPALQAIHEALAAAGDDETARLLPLAPGAASGGAGSNPTADSPTEAAAGDATQPEGSAIDRRPLSAGGSLPAAQELARLRPLARLRLFRLLLIGAPPAALLAAWREAGRKDQPGSAGESDHAMPSVLSGLDAAGWWSALGRNFAGPARHPAGPWRELLRAQALTPEAVDAALAAESGPRLLEESLFEGEPAQVQVWRDAVAWFETSPRAAGLVPGGQTGLRARLWAALAELVRESGGRPVRDAMAFLVRALARLGAARGAGGSTAEREAASAVRLRAALAGDGSRSALALAARVRTTPADQSARREPAPRRLPDRGQADDDPGAEPVWVDNAGLVLLAPFFPRLFERCGLLDDGEFAGFEAGQRAVHLLQFLVTGDAARRHEFSLALNKVLCGFEPETPVVPDVELAPEECAAATGLLEFAADQWPRGATVSPEGLRHSFLRRPGRLARGEESWNLKVETRGWDVLLPGLAWTFPGPKPKWMPRPLHVDWI